MCVFLNDQKLRLINIPVKNIGIWFVPTCYLMKVCEEPLICTERCFPTARFQCPSYARCHQPTTENIRKLLQVAPVWRTAQCNKSKGNSVKYVPYVSHYDPDHDHKNMTLKRPMSPHMTHYAPTLPAMTSIAQRITGGIITSYALLLAWGALFLPNGAETYVSIIQGLNLGTLTIIIIKLLLGAPFTFHYFNAMRYIAWNAGKMFDMKSVYDSSYKSMMAAGAAAAFFAII